VSLRRRAHFLVSPGARGRSATDRPRIDLAWSGSEIAPAGLVPLIRQTGLSVEEFVALLGGVTGRVTVALGL